MRINIAEANTLVPSYKDATNSRGSFSRQHYQAIADIIMAEMRDSEGNEVPAALKSVVKKMCIFFKNDNLRFDQAKFMRACGF